MAADEHRLTRIENKVLIGVHRCLSAAQIDFFTASEEPRPLMFYFRWLGCPHCGPNLDAGAWRHTSTPDRSRRPPRRIWMRKITATGGGQVAQDEGTLLIGINPGVASGCNHGLAHGTWDHAFKWAQRHHWLIGLLRATCCLYQTTANWCGRARFLASMAPWHAGTSF